MEKSFDPPIGNVDSRFDLFAEDKQNRIIVNIQHVRYADHYARFLHYRRVFDLIARDLISPQEYACMKDEYSLEQLQQDKFEQGLEKGRISERQETARKMLADGLDTGIVMKYTGFSSDVFRSTTGFCSCS